MKKLFFLLTFFLSCANNKYTWIYKKYHQTNAQYNALYHIEEDWQILQQKINQEPPLEYENRLNFENYHSKTAKKYQNVYEDLLKRSFQNIEIHSLLVNGKELNPVIPLYWLRIGEIYLQTFQSESAVEIFTKVQKETEEVNLKIRAALGKIKAHLQEKRVDLAYPRLFELRKFLENDEEIKQKEKEYFTLNLNILFSDYYFLQKEYLSALGYLEIVLKEKQNRKISSRYYFIAAQLAKMIENKEKAKRYFDQVIALNANFEERLEAILQSALLDVSEKRDDAIVKKLLKETKYKSNKNYLPKIYLNLGILEEYWQNDAAAADYFSLAKLLSNEQTQGKGILYFQLANAFYKQKKYIFAQNYYTEALEFLNPQSPQYEEANKKSKNLKNIYELLIKLEETDTLILLSKSSNDVKENWLKEKAKKTTDTTLNLQNKKNIFNPTLLNSYIPLFIKTWGERPLEDDWRNKSTIYGKILTQEEQLEGIANSAQTPFFTQEEDFQKADSLQIERYYQLGILFKEQLKDTSTSVDFFNKLLEKYPKNNYFFPIQYQLFLIFQAKNQNDTANQYRNILEKECPKCPETALLSQKKSEETLNELEEEKKYQKAFAYFKEGKYKESLFICDEEILIKNKKYLKYYLYLKTECLKELGLVKEWRKAEAEKLNYTEL